jgi:tubulin gamma
MERETVSLQIGRCGIQLGNEFWKRLCGEHSLTLQGKEIFKKKNIFDKKILFFKETKEGFFKPRTFLFDLEPRILHKLMKSNYKNIYEKKNILFSNQGTGNNWANGYYKSLEFQYEIEEILRKHSENCDNLGSFNIFNSIVGGTGGGSGCYLMEMIKDEFPGKFINCFTVIPERKGAFDTIVQPYNSILSFRWLKLYTDCVTFFENGAIENIINCWNESIKPSLREINYLISKIICVSTQNVRLSSHPNQNWESSVIPLIPTPNLHFLLTNIANLDFFSKKKKDYIKSWSKEKLFIKNQTVSLSFETGKMLSSLQFVRNQMEKNVDCFFLTNNLKREKPISLNWEKTPCDNIHISEEMKWDFNEKKISYFNHTAIKDIFSETYVRYNILRKRNAFLASYLKNFPAGDGIDLFEDAKESIYNLIEEFKWAENSNFF